MSIKAKENIFPNMDFLRIVVGFVKWTFKSNINFDLLLYKDSPHTGNFIDILSEFNLVRFDLTTLRETLKQQNVLSSHANIVIWLQVNKPMIFKIYKASQFSTFNISYNQMFFIFNAANYYKSDNYHHHDEPLYLNHYALEENKIINENVLVTTKKDAYIICKYRQDNTVAEIKSKDIIIDITESLSKQQIEAYYKSDVYIPAIKHPQFISDALKEYTG